MKVLNPAWIEAISGQVNQCPYFDLQSMILGGLSWGESSLEVALQKKHIQPWGVVHGGVLAGLVDAAGFWAVYSQIPEGQSLTTVEMKLNFLAPVKEGLIKGMGRSIKIGRTLSLGEAKVEGQDGCILAHGLVTLMRVDSWNLQGEASLPPKYLSD